MDQIEGVRMNIRRKIGLSMTTLAFVVVIFVGLFSNLIARDTLKDRGKDFLVSILNRTSYEINLEVNAMEKVTEFIYDDFILTYNFQNGSTNEVYLERYLEKFEGTVQLAAELSPSKSAYLVLLSDGIQEVVWYQDYNNDGIPERHYETLDFERFDYETIPTDTLTWTRTQSPATQISAIKVIHQNNTTAIVGTDLNFYSLKSKLDTSKYLDSGVLFLVDGNGDVIYHPNQLAGTAINPIFLEDKSMEAVEQNNESGVSIVLAKSILNNEWMLLISAETSDIFLGLSRLNYIILIILIIASSVAVVYSIMVSKRIADPYLYLTGKVEEIGKGNYDVVFDEEYVDRDDEVGDFTKALKQTVKRQKDSFEEINNYNQNLEAVILDRTKELVQTNNALEESVIDTEEKQEKLEVTNQQLEVSIIEIKKTRKQLIKTEKIASSRYMAIGIAHNLNTPIGSAKAIASFIESRTEKIIEKFTNKELTKRNLNEFLIETKSGSQKILESIDDSIQLIDKMKALSLIKTTQNVSLVNVEEIIKMQVENTKREHPNFKCGFTILVDANLEFRCDFYNLQKIFYELIENSYTHAFNDVSHPHITIKAYRNDMVNNGIILEYYDNGVGIDNTSSSELFTPLYTTKLSTRHGLGLTMVHNLVIERFDGDIMVETVNNRGLGFYIKLYEVNRDADVEEVSYDEKYD